MATMVQLVSAAPMERAYSTLSSAGQRSMVALVRLAVQERVAAADLLAQALTSLQRRMAIDSSASTPWVAVAVVAVQEAVAVVQALADKVAAVPLQF